MPKACRHRATGQPPDTAVMRIISSDEIDTCLTERDVLEAIRTSYRTAALAPDVPPLRIPRPHDLDAALSFQTAWADFEAQGHVDRGYIGCGLSLTSSAQAQFGSGLYVLFSGKSGQPLALLDGIRLSSWSRAGEHALAANYLSREDSTRLLVLGSDPKLPLLLSAYRSVRKLTSVLFSGTSQSLVKRIKGLPAFSGLSIGFTEDRSGALEGADIVCLAGPDSDQPSWSQLSYLDLPAGCHLDVLATDTPLPAGLLQDSRLFTTDRETAPIDGLEWAADLRELAQGEKAGRRYYGQRTLFLPSSHSASSHLALAAHIFLRT